MVDGPSSKFIPMTNRCAIYARISLDREGDKESPKRQEAECRSFAGAKEWDVVGIYVDRDTSAYATTARRPEFERMLRDVDAGLLDVVLVWKLDRLTRQGPRGIGKILDRLDAGGAVLASVQESLDATTTMGEAMIGVIASLGKAESEAISVRVKSAHDTAARQGKMHSGGSRQFGYDRDGRVNKKEAKVVREVVERIGRGESLRQIAFDLNRRDVETTMGNAWRSVTLGQMMRSPRLAALRVYQPRRGGQREVFAGNWEPILTAEEHAELLGALSRPLAVRRSVKRHLLTGVAVCGICGGAVKTMGFRMKNGRPFERYQCVKQPGEVNCGGVAAAKKSLDAFVTAQLLDFLARASLRPIEGDLPDEAELRRLLDEDEAALAELVHERFVRRTIRPADYEAARTALDDRIAGARQTLDAVEAKRREARLDLPLGDREALDGWWESATVEERREVVARSVAQVIVNPAKHRGGNRFDTGRIDLRYRWDVFMRAAAEFDRTATDEERDQAEAEYHALGLEDL